MKKEFVGLYSKRTGAFGVTHVSHHPNHSKRFPMPRRKTQSRSPDLSGYSIAELSQLIRDAERQRDRLRRQNVGEARRKIMSDLKEIGLSVADLFPGVHRNSNAGTTSNTQKRGRGRPRIKPAKD